MAQTIERNRTQATDEVANDYIQTVDDLKGFIVWRKRLLPLFQLLVLPSDATGPFAAILDNTQQELFFSLRQMWEAIPDQLPSPVKLTVRVHKDHGMISLTSTVHDKWSVGLAYHLAHLYSGVPTKSDAFTAWFDADVDMVVVAR